MSTVVIMPGGFHPFHAGHMALYNSAREAFPGADVYVAASNDTKNRPFPFSIKEKLAKVAGVQPGHFVQVKSPFQPKEITQNYDPEKDVVIFVRSQKDMKESPIPGGVKKNGEPSYLQPFKRGELEPFAKHAYMAYLPTVEFGPGITSATEIRNAWPNLDEKRKTAMVMSLYPATQKNPKLANNVVQMLDMAMSGELTEDWKSAVAGGAMALSALGAGAQTMPNMNTQQLELANKYYNVLVQRAKEDGIPLDTRTLNILKAKAHDAAAQKTQQVQPKQQSQNNFPSQGSERRVTKDINQFESQVEEGDVVKGPWKNKDEDDWDDDSWIPSIEDFEQEEEIRNRKPKPANDINEGFIDWLKSKFKKDKPADTWFHNLPKEEQDALHAAYYNAYGDPKHKDAYLRHQERTKPQPQKQEFIAPHGSAQDELKMFLNGTKPAALVNDATMALWNRIIQSGKYVVEPLKMAGKLTGYVVGQPGEEDRVEKLRRLVQGAQDAAEQGDNRAYQNSNYHRWVGKLLGYPADKIETFIQNYFKDKQNLAKQEIHEEDDDFWYEEEFLPKRTYQNIVRSVFAKTYPDVKPIVEGDDEGDGSFDIITSDEESGFQLMLSVSKQEGEIIAFIERAYAGNYKGVIGQIIGLLLGSAKKRWGKPPNGIHLVPNDDISGGYWSKLAQQLGVQYSPNSVYSQRVSETKIGSALSWPEFVNKISSAMKMTGWKVSRKGDDGYIFSTKGQETEDQYYIVVIENIGNDFFAYSLGTVEEGDPDIGFSGELPITYASLSELINMIREGYGLNENKVSSLSESADYLEEK